LAALEEEGARGSRQEKIKLQQQLREAEEAHRVYMLNKMKNVTRQRNDTQRAELKERRQLDDDMDKLLQREALVDRQIRKCQGSYHPQPLGYDRFWNRFWWFDGYGSGITAVNEYGLTSAQTNTKATRNQPVLLPFASGRLWVEGVGRCDFLGHVSGCRGRQAGKRRMYNSREGINRDQDPFITLPEGFNGIGVGDVGPNTKCPIFIICLHFSLIAVGFG
jgi:hypothetical protein